MQRRALPRVGRKEESSAGAPMPRRMRRGHRGLAKTRKKENSMAKPREPRIRCPQCNWSGPIHSIKIGPCGYQECPRCDKHLHREIARAEAKQAQARARS